MNHFMPLVVAIATVLNKKSRHLWNEIVGEGGRAFAVQATKEWNKLSVDIKQSTSVKSFKRSLFKIILDNQILSKLFL